jgi:outer membrane protein assembly factor BamB
MGFLMRKERCCACRPRSWNSGLFKALLFTVCGLLLAGCGGIKLGQSIKHGPSDWPMFARVPARTNATTEAIQPPLSLVWQQDINGGIGAGSPLVVDTLLFVGNLRGELQAMNALTGKHLGRVNLGEAIQGGPVVIGNTAIVASANVNESLSAFDLYEGRTRWKSSCGDIEASPLVYNNRVYVANTQGVAFCVDKITGEVLWKFEIPENIHRKGFRSSPAAEGDRVVLGGEDGIVYALDPERGKLRWTYNAGASIVAPVGMSIDAVYAGDLNGMFHAVSAVNGHPLWKFDTGSSIYAGPTIAPGTVVIGTTGGLLFALDTANGAVRWKTDLGGVINSSAVAANSMLFVGTLSKQLFAIDVGNGSVLWKYETPGRIKTSPAAANGKLYIATDERLVLAFQGAKQ